MKELNEILDALDLTLDTAGAVLEDGKVDLGDLKHGLTLINNYKVFTGAVEGAKEAWPEIKDLDQADAIAIGVRVYGSLKKLVDIVKAAKALDSNEDAK